MVVRFTAHYLEDGQVKEQPYVNPKLRNMASIDFVKKKVYSDCPEVFLITHQILQEVNI